MSPRHIRMGNSSGWTSWLPSTGAASPGISNTFSEALWGIDTLFNYVNVGMDGVNLSTGEGTQYALFDLHRGTRNGIFVWDVQQVNARYYAVLAFTSMLGNNARLLPVSTTTTANVSVWATVDDVSTVHLLVINKDQQAAGDVQITLPGYSTGTVRYLLAASYGACQRSNVWRTDVRRHSGRDAPGDADTDDHYPGQRSLHLTRHADHLRRPDQLHALKRHPDPPLIRRKECRFAADLLLPRPQMGQMDG